MRPLKKIIDIKALQANWERIAAQAGAADLIAVVKANAYGHDARTVASALDAQFFAVACIEEAIELRNFGIKQPIILLEGVFSADEYLICQKLGFEVVVHQFKQLEWLDNDQVKIWFKIDSGMHRLGFSNHEMAKLIDQYRGAGNVQGVVSHFACADEENLEDAKQQLALLNKLSYPTHWQRCFANSAAIFALDNVCFDKVRPGIMLYGISPFSYKSARDLGLSPVMTLQTEIIAVHYLKKGESAGYGSAFIAEEDGYLATIAGGYGDGFSREIPSGKVPVLIGGELYYRVGRVAMDMSMVWLSKDHYPTGEKVIFFGKELSIEKVAAAAGTIPYTLTTMLTKRVHLEVVNG